MSGRAIAVEAEGIGRRFGRTQALRDVSISVREGEIHALLGPNGAGKTTLLRILMGLVDPNAGTIRLQGTPKRDLPPRSYRGTIGLIPSGDRTFYMRISGMENLLFFGRMHGLSRVQALQRARESLEAVDLSDAARVRVGVYSHGMQKRLSVARALLMDPAILLVDEATHDLDPEGARRVRRLVADAAGRGRAVVWTTQRVDEIRGFADAVTVLDRGEVRFSGSVPKLMEVYEARRFLVHLRAPGADAESARRVAAGALGAMGAVDPGGDADGEHCVMTLEDGVVLGDAISALAASGLQVLACREESSEIEEAVLRLTGGGHEPAGGGPR